MKRGREEEELNEIKKFHFACKCGEISIVKKLIERGLDMNVRDECKRTPLHFAASAGPVDCEALNGLVDVAKALIQNGADVNAVDKWKCTPLHYAAIKGSVDVAKVLIQNGVDVNAVDKDKLVPLHYATAHGHVDVAKVLIQNGADVNDVDLMKQTLLYFAAAHRDVFFALQLLCFGAVIDKRVLENDRQNGGCGLLDEINDRMNLLRAGKRPETSLMSNEERRFMWNLAFSLTIQHPAAAFKAHYTIRSFITFHGIFMATGYDLGEESVWNRTVQTTM